jgi:hypothetical protein
MPSMMASLHSLPGVISRGATQQRMLLLSKLATAASAIALSFDE